MTTLDWIKIINEFKSKGIKIVHRSALESLYSGTKASLSVIINRLEKKGLIKRITKDWLCFPPCEVWEIVRIVFPTAYISLEWALHYHDIIDQEIKIITLVSLNKTRCVKNSYVFEIHKISRKLHFGFDEKRIAEPEKALLDTIYLRKKVAFDLNIELLNTNRLKKYMKKFPKRVQMYVKEILDMET